MDRSVIDWLLEESNPSIRYRTLMELLNEDQDSELVQNAKSHIATSKPVQKILSKMHPDGYWLQTNPRTKRTVGEGVEYGAFATTHFCLAYLAELGMDRSNPAIEKAAERYLNLQSEDGDFWNHMSCLNGYNIRNFIMLGYEEDPRLQRTIDLMLASKRRDGGYLCDMHEKKRTNKKSCVRGCGKMLMAYAMLPELWGHERCKELVDYFLRRNCIFSHKHPDEFVNKDIENLVFPFVWRFSVLELLWSLSRMGLGNHPATVEAWKLLNSKQTDAGTYDLDGTPSQASLKVGKRGEPNKWLTFYALQAQKLRVT